MEVQNQISDLRLPIMVLNTLGVRLPPLHFLNTRIKYWKSRRDEKLNVGLLVGETITKNSQKCLIMQRHPINFLFLHSIYSIKIYTFSKYCPL